MTVVLWIEGYFLTDDLPLPSRYVLCDLRKEEGIGYYFACPYGCPDEAWLHLEEHAWLCNRCMTEGTVKVLWGWVGDWSRH